MTWFLRLFVITILVCCRLSSTYCRPPPSPCPNVFAYEGEFERDRWYGVISFTSNIELAGLNIKVQLDQPSELLVAWDGEIRSVDNTFYHIFNPFSLQQAGETMKVRIMAKFNPARSPPTIRSIVIDGTTVCASGQSLIPSKDVISYIGSVGGGSQQFPAAATITERIDPSFNGNVDDLSSEYQHKGTQADFDRNNGPVNSVQYNRGTQVGMGSGYDADKGTQVDDSHFNRDRIVNPSSISTQYDNRGSSIGSGFNQYDRRPQLTSFGTVDDGNIPYNGQSSHTGNQASGDRTSQWPSENPTAGWSGNSAVSGINQNSVLPSGASQLSSQSTANNYPNYQYQPSQSSSDVSSNKNPSQQNPSQQNPSQQNLSNGAGPIVTTLTIPNHVNDKNINQIVELIKNQLEQQKNNNMPTNGTYIVALVNPMIPANLESTNNSADSRTSLNVTQRSSSTANNAAVQNPAASPTAATNRQVPASSAPKVQKVSNSATTTPRNRHSAQV